MLQRLVVSVPDMVPSSATVSVTSRLLHPLRWRLSRVTPSGRVSMSVSSLLPIPTFALTFQVTLPELLTTVSSVCQLPSVFTTPGL